MSDVFDYFGEKIAKSLVATCRVYDRMKEPFRSGGITALEEFAFRVSGEKVHFDWEEFKAAERQYRSMRRKRAKKG